MEYTFTSTQAKRDTRDALTVIDRIVQNWGCGVSYSIKQGWFRDTITVTVRGKNARKIIDILLKVGM